MNNARTILIMAVQPPFGQLMDMNIVIMTWRGALFLYKVKLVVEYYTVIIVSLVTKSSAR